jgi:hypothetical protein
MRRVLCEEYGRDPEQILKEIDMEPLGSASNAAREPPLISSRPAAAGPALTGPVAARTPVIGPAHFPCDSIRSG